jgi:hypothetical protein
MGFNLGFKGLIDLVGFMGVLNLVRVVYKTAFCV